MKRKRMQRNTFNSSDDSGIMVSSAVNAKHWFIALKARRKTLIRSFIYFGTSVDASAVPI